MIKLVQKNLQEHKHIKRIYQIGQKGGGSSNFEIPHTAAKIYSNRP